MSPRGNNWSLYTLLGNEMHDELNIVVGPFLAHLADIVGLSFWGPRFISLSCFFALRVVVARTTKTSLTSTSVVLSGANFTSASARLTSVWNVWIPDLQRWCHHARELAVWVYRTVTLRLRNVGVRRVAVLLLQLNSTDEKILTRQTSCYRTSAIVLIPAEETSRVLV